MATVKASRGSMKGGELRAITITIQGNGFTVTEDRVPKVGKNGPMWEPSKPSDSMIFETPDGAIDYVRKCLPTPKQGPSGADEKSEKS